MTTGIDDVEWLDAKVCEQAKRIAELEKSIREYLGEYDTPAKDYAYRTACRDKLRTLVEQ